MPIEFRCTQCNKLLRTGDETAGQQAKCPECGTISTIPPLRTPLSEGQPPPPGPTAGTPVEPQESAGAGLTPFGPVGQQAPADLRAYAIGRVSGPATALIVLGALGIPFAIFATVLNITGAAPQFPDQFPDPELAKFFEDFQDSFRIGQIVSGFVGIGVAILLIVGGIKMKNLQNYGLCMAAAIIAVIPCFSPCCCLEVPFGIWALVVLLNKQVSTAFGA